MPAPLFNPHALTLDASRRWVGYAALVRGLGLSAPVAAECAVANGHIRGSVRTEDGVRIFDQRYRPTDDVGGHLHFALKHEALDLLVLSRVLGRMGPEAVTDIVGANPARQHARQLWFLYEWLTGERLPLPDLASGGHYVPLLEPAQYFLGEPASWVRSPRHKVLDNLPGSPAFCPLVRRTPPLEAFTSQGLDTQVQAVMGHTAPDVWRRAASFLLLADSRASFAIEGERPARNRIERWAHVIQQAGRRALSMDELLRMHAALIHDDRFVAKGLRGQGVFLGDRDRFGDPVPEFIGARAQDLAALLTGLLQTDHLLGVRRIDPVIHAAIIAFGLVFIHPFEDGNGRMHRALIHHVLAERGVAPGGLVFPVSAVMLERIHEYREALRAHTSRLMPFIDWTPDAQRNVAVHNDTADLYRYGDYTPLAEFLYACVAHTVTELLPQEVRYLQCHDRALTALAQHIDLPQNLARDLIMFVTQNDMKLPIRRRKGEFASLTDDEIEVLETEIARAFNDTSDAAVGRLA